VESDCQELITAVKAQTEVTSRWAGLIHDIKAVSHLLPACSFIHVKTNGNVVAHQLAHRAMQHSECVVRRFSAQECVCEQCILEAEGAHNPDICNSIEIHQ
jgi:hypothetical protein